MGNANGSNRKDPTPVASASTAVRLPQKRNFVFPRPGTTVGVTNYVHPEPIRSCITERNVELPQSWTIWDQNYYPGRVRPEELEKLSSRISEQSHEIQRHNETRIEEIKLQRLKETNNAYIRLETIPKPTLSINALFPIDRALAVFRSHDKKYFSSEGKLPELTPDILDIVNNASRSSPSGEILVQIEEVEIMRKDIQTLLRLNWLNDEIIYAYMLLLVARGRQPDYKKVYSFNTFFYPKLKEAGYNSVRRWTRKVDIFSYDFVLVPVHLGNHWCLAVIDFTQRIISYYDSLGGSTHGCCDLLLDYLRDESRDKKKQDFDDENWRLANGYSEGIPTQTNCSDCGVFACTYAEYLTRQAKLNFSQKNMPYFRKKMIYEIITKQILE